jgi:hypothetical protein
MKVRVWGLKDLKCSQPGHLLKWRATAFTMGEFALAAASSEAPFIGIAETATTPIRLIPNAPTAARMMRIVFPPW